MEHHHIPRRIRGIRVKLRFRATLFTTQRSWKKPGKGQQAAPSTASSLRREGILRTINGIRNWQSSNKRFYGRHYHNDSISCTSRVDPKGTWQHGNMGNNGIQTQRVKKNGQQKWEGDQQVPAPSLGRGYTVPSVEESPIKCLGK